MEKKSEKLKEKTIKIIRNLYCLHKAALVQDKTMGNTLSMVVLAPIRHLYEHGFRNTDEEFPYRKECPSYSYKHLTLTNDGDVLRVPVYVCNVERGPPSPHPSGEGRYDFIRFWVGEESQEHEIDVIHRDLDLEHESSLLGCKVCTALGLSAKLGLIYIYSVLPIPLPPSVPSTSSQGVQECECSICYEEGQLVSTPCGHMFHDHCLRRWSMINPTCPHCRRPTLI